MPSYVGCYQILNLACGYILHNCCYCNYHEMVLFSQAQHIPLSANLNICDRIFARPNCDYPSKITVTQ
jgi:hypothetical protein